MIDVLIDLNCGTSDNTSHMHIAKAVQHVRTRHTIPNTFPLSPPLPYFSPGGGANGCPLSSKPYPAAAATTPRGNPGRNGAAVQQATKTAKETNRTSNRRPRRPRRTARTMSDTRTQWRSMMATLLFCCGCHQRKANANDSEKFFTAN